MPNILELDDKKQIAEYYSKSLNQYGPYDPRSVHWNDFYTQNIRFKELIRIGNLENKNLLDIGCGLGDFYFYLKSNFSLFHYTGIDISDDLINSAELKYPEAQFRKVEVSEVLDGVYNYAFASGVFSLRVEDYECKYMNTIKQGYDKITQGFAFNMLKKGKHPEDDIHVTWNPDQVIKTCKKYCSKMKLIEGYLDYDFTIYLYK